MTAQTQKQLPLEALSDVVKAWESLQGQSYHSVKAVEDWLAGPMLKAINNAREVLKTTNAPVTAQRPTVNSVMYLIQQYVWKKGAQKEENAAQCLAEIQALVEALAAPVAAQPTELEELRKLVKDFPLNDRDVPIIYNTNEIDQITYALTGDDGEDDSVTVLQRLVRSLSGKTVYNLLEEAEAATQPPSAPLLVRDLATCLCVQPLAVCEALKEFGFGNFSVNMAVPVDAVKVIESKFALPQQTKPETLTADDLKEPKNGKQWHVEWWNESCRMMLPSGSKLDSFHSYKNGTLQFTIKKTDKSIKE